jgi:carbonic anhydrase
MSDLNEILKNNESWSSDITNNNETFFTEGSKSQSPRYLWIGCADSRVPAAQLCGLGPGDVFVHRNIANLVLKDDLNCLSVLEYAVKHLKVKDIIVCGHYGCGGVQAAMSGDSFGRLDPWLKNISVGDVDFNKACELNVQNQINTLKEIDVIKEAWSEGQELTLHGLIYDLSSGRLIDQKISVSGLD